MEDDLEALVAELRDRHGCHTVILYGSHARGDAMAESDFDVIGVRDEGPMVRDARAWRGSYLDAFIHPVADLQAPDESWLKLVGARVLVERGVIGTRLLAAVDAIFAQGPTPLDEPGRMLVHSWQRKTLDRLARGDMEGDYRRVMLLHQAIEDYFALRNAWYMGPKVSFAWLRRHDPAVLRAYEAALVPGADIRAIRELVALVLADVALPPSAEPASSDGGPHGAETV